MPPGVKLTLALVAEATEATTLVGTAGAVAGAV